MMPYGRRRRRSYTRRVKPKPHPIPQGEPKKPASFFARLWASIKGLVK